MRIHGYFNENDEPALKLDLISKSILVRRANQDSDRD